jgi:transcriptional regulator with XRE-family HTH domain
LITSSELWPKFKDSKRYREEFAAQLAKEAVPFQIVALLKQFKLTQTELASRARVTQGVVSRAADISNGNLTINTIIRMAAGFDVAFVPLFVPFSEIPQLFRRLYEEPFSVPSFMEEDARIEDHACEAALHSEQPSTLADEFNVLTQRMSEEYGEELRAIAQKLLTVDSVDSAFADFLASVTPPDLSASQSASLSSLLNTQQSMPASSDNLIDFAQRKAQQKAANGSVNELMTPANAGIGAKNG